MCQRILWLFFQGTGRFNPCLTFHKTNPRLMSDTDTTVSLQEMNHMAPGLYPWLPWFSGWFSQWLWTKHGCWSGKHNEVKSWWAHKSTVNQPLNQLGYFGKCVVFSSGFIFSCSELILGFTKLEYRNEKRVKVSAYTGTQRTQVHEQELQYTMIQETILLFTENEDTGGPSWA